MSNRAEKKNAAIASAPATEIASNEKAERKAAKASAKASAKAAAKAAAKTTAVSDDSVVVDAAAKLAAKELKSQQKAQEKAQLKAAAKASAHAAKSAAKLAKAERKAAKSAQPNAVSEPTAFKHLRKRVLSSGKGETPLEIGQSLVALFNAGKSEEAESTWYHRKIESIEADGRVFEGWKGVLEKGKWWRENFTVLAARAEGPFVCSTGFTVIYSGSARMSNGTVIDLAETGVYTVKQGRIVREQFMRKA